MYPNRIVVFQRHCSRSPLVHLMPFCRSNMKRSNFQWKITRKRNNKIVDVQNTTREELVLDTCVHYSRLIVTDFMRRVLLPYKLIQNPFIYNFNVNYMADYNSKRTLACHTYLHNVCHTLRILRAQLICFIHILFVLFVIGGSNLVRFFTVNTIKHSTNIDGFFLLPQQAKLLLFPH